MWESSNSWEIDGGKVLKAINEDFWYSKLCVMGWEDRISRDRDKEHFLKRALKRRHIFPAVKLLCDLERFGRDVQDIMYI